MSLSGIVPRYFVTDGWYGVLAPCTFAPTGSHLVQYSPDGKQVKWNCPMEDDAVHETAMALGALTCRHTWRPYAGLDDSEQP